MVALRVVPVTDEAGHIIEPQLLSAAAQVHRQLRPMLPDDYPAKMARVFAGGARMVVAVHDTQVLGLALYRLYENTYQNLRLYVDDLVTDQNVRSQGVGGALLDWCDTLARSRGAEWLALDSGTWRTDAHRLYFRKGMVISSFHFTRQLNDQ